MQWGVNSMDVGSNVRNGAVTSYLYVFVGQIHINWCDHSPVRSLEAAQRSSSSERSLAPEGLKPLGKIGQLGQNDSRSADQ